MTKKLCIASHNLRSNALKSLQTELTDRVGYKVFRVYPHRVRSRIPVTFHKGVNKLEQFRAFAAAEVPSPAFATTIDAARQLPGDLVVCRTLLRGSEGKGIIIQEKAALTQRAPLYTQYIKKKAEYRVHVYNNKVIDVQIKLKKKDSTADGRIRNTNHGYVFSRSFDNVPNDLAAAAISAIQALGRTQGAVDCIWNERQNKTYVLEVNSRPGLVGTTLQKYSDAILTDENIRRIPC